MNYFEQASNWLATHWDMLIAHLSSMELSIQAFSDAFVKDVPSVLIILLLAMLSMGVHLLSRYTRSLKMTVAELRKEVHNLKNNSLK